MIDRNEMETIRQEAQQNRAKAEDAFRSLQDSLGRGTDRIGEALQLPEQVIRTSPLICAGILALAGFIAATTVSEKSPSA